MLHFGQILFKRNGNYSTYNNKVLRYTILLNIAIITRKFIFVNVYVLLYKVILVSLTGTYIV